MNLADEWRTFVDARKSIPVFVEALPRILGIGYKKAYLHDDISGMIENVKSGFLITINANNVRTRQRFTLAHELGHYMLHRHLIGDGVDDDRAYRSTSVGKYHNTQIGPDEEIEANKFAANLLMPRDRVEYYSRNVFDRWDPNEKIHRMAALFQVSERSMEICLNLFDETHTASTGTGHPNPLPDRDIPTRKA